MTVQIPLRGKYRSAVKGKYKGGENADRKGKRKRNKIGDVKHNALFGEPPKKHKVVDGKTGKSRMERV
jgi:hypothetical protein